MDFISLCITSVTFHNKIILQSNEFQKKVNNKKRKKITQDLHMCHLDTKIITLMFSLKKSINYNPNNIIKLYMFTMDWVQV